MALTPGKPEGGARFVWIWTAVSLVAALLLLVPGRATIFPYAASGGYMTAWLVVGGFPVAQASRLCK